MEKEIKQEENIFSDKFKENISKIYKEIKKYLNKIWEFLKSNGFKKIMGFLIVLITSISLFVETIYMGLIHSDKLKFQEILNYFYNFKIFDYVSNTNFYLITGGGYLLDLTFYLIVIALGVFLWKDKKCFKKRNFKILISITFILGVILFSFGFYKSMPKIMEPIKKIQHSYEKSNERSEHGWLRERKNFDNGFLEKGHYNGKNLKEDYYKFYYSDF